MATRDWQQHIKGAKIFNGHSGIWHLHYVHLAHYHMPQNTDCDPLGCVGVRQCKKPRQSNSFRLRQVWRRGAMRSWKCRFRTCANERVWASVKLRSHALKFKEKWISRSTLSATMQKTRCGYLFLGFKNKCTWKCVRERRAWPTLINPTWSKKGYWRKLMWVPYYYSNSCE